MHRVSLSYKFNKDFRKVDREAQLFIRKKYFKLIIDNPLFGDRLIGKKYKEVLCVKFKFKKVDYRLIYRVENKILLIVMIAIGTCENFYKKLIRRI